MFSCFSSLISLFCLNVELLMGLKASLTLGREEKPWVKGLLGLNIVFEKILPHDEKFFFLSWSMGSIELKCLLMFGRYNGFCKKEEIL